MKKLLILAILLVYSNTAFADSGIFAVFVKNGEIVLSAEDAGQVQLTHNGIPKSKPVWSKDGSMIAFMENTDKKVALDRLVVISRSGEPLYSFPIHPVSRKDNWIESGMRFVERVEWLNNSKIAVSGSINPSTIETIIFDLFTRNISRDYFLSDGYPTYSPDGHHVAYIGLVAHFTPRSEREPELYVDNGQRIFPPVGTKVDFISEPAWSADSQTLAIAAMNLDTSMSNIVIWHSANAQPLLVPLPIKEEKDHYIKKKLLWNGDALTVISDQQAWSYAQGRFSEISLSQAMSRKQDALNIKKTQEASLGVGAGQSDFWCQSCPLSLLPRKSPIYDHNVE